MRFIATRRSGDLSGVVRWSRSREGRACFLAAIAGVGLTLALYRSESSSAASAGPALSPLPERAPVTRPIGASVRSEPLAITPTATNIPTAAAAREAAAEMPSGAIDAMNDDAVNDDADDDTAPTTTQADVSQPSDDSVRSAPRKAARAKSKSRASKRRAKHSRRAKRQSATRGGRAKRRRATAAGPLAAWLATQHSKKASSSKHR